MDEGFREAEVSVGVEWVRQVSGRGSNRRTERSDVVGLWHGRGGVEDVGRGTDSGVGVGEGWMGERGGREGLEGGADGECARREADWSRGAG